METAKTDDRTRGGFPRRLKLRIALILLAAVVVCHFVLIVVTFFVGMASAFAPPSATWPTLLTLLAWAQFALAAFGLCAVAWAIIERVVRRPFVGWTGLMACMVAVGIVICAFAGRFRHRLYLNMTAKGNAACYEGVHPCLSPDGRTLVFGAPCPGGMGGDIVTLDIASRATKNLTRSTEWSRGRPDLLDYVGWLILYPLQPVGPYNGDPSFSPDGSKIVFISNREENLAVYVMDRDGSNQIPLTHTDEDESCPSFSPDGTMIIFSRTRSRPSPRTDLGSDCVWVMRADGSFSRPLTAFLVEGDTPCWSPDGSEIVFYGQPNYSARATIWLVRADGTQLRPLSLEGQCPSFLSDSNALVMVNERYEGSNIGCEIAIANRDGTAARDITATSSYKRSPRISPDGRSILFALDPKRKVHNDNFRDGGLNWEVWMIDRDGANPRRMAFAYLAR